MNLSFARLEEGYENALKDYYKKQVCSVSYMLYVHDSVDLYEFQTMRCHVVLGRKQTLFRHIF